jgi:quinol monooxygenase YgiN
MSPLPSTCLEEANSNECPIGNADLAETVAVATFVQMTTTREMPRRDFLCLTGAMLVGVGTTLPAFTPVSQPTPMHGLIGKMKATPGQRDALAAILLDGTADMPGCLSYIIATDPTDADALWITEVWDSAESHQASLKLPGVQAAIAKGRPLIAGFGERFETVPIGGHGLARA